MASELFSSVDAAWLHIDRPTNIAMIVGVMIFDTPIGLPRLAAVLQERLLVYDRFRQRVKEPLLRLGRPRWESDPHFDLNYHVQRIQLPGTGSIADLQKLVGDLMSTPLDPRRPLWQMYYVENFDGGCAIIPRLHHCIADGLALVQVLLSLTDTQPDVSHFTPPARPAPQRSSFNLLQPLGQAVGTTTTTARRLALETLRTATEPSRVTQAASVGALGALATGKLLLLPPDHKTIVNGLCHVEKRAAWSMPIPLRDVSSIGKAMQGTVNDVLLAVATGALRRYMEKRDQPVAGVNIRTMVPVSLRAAGDLDKLGNQFGLVLLSLPIGVRDPLARMNVLKQRMDAIKGTPEAWVAFNILGVMGLTPVQIEKIIIDFFVAKVSAVMTNVPGPRQPLYMAGQRLRSLMFWVPRAGNVGLGLSILSYAGDVYVGIATDAGLMPDPQAIVAEFHAEFADMLQQVQSPRSNIGTTRAPLPNGRCHAMTKSGLPCKNRALPNTMYCNVHARQFASMADGIQS